MNKDVLFKIKELYHLIGKAMYVDSNIKPTYKPTSTQVRFIDYLCTHENEIVTGHILEKTFNLSKATVSDVLNTMEKHKIITRVIDMNDTRIKKITLNDEARNVHKTIMKEMKKIQKVITQNISNEELNDFNETINKIEKNIYDFLEKERTDNNDKNV